MGRKKSTCVQYFELTKDEQMKCEKAKCRFCGWVSAKNTVRMKTHLAKHCTACPEQVKREYHEQIEEDVTEVRNLAIRKALPTIWKLGKQTRQTAFVRGACFHCWRLRRCAT